MLKKVLVANRGEIAVRAFRAGYELGIRTVAVYTHEDRGSLHRLKADEAYEIGEPGHPIRAYLDPQAMVDLAVRVGADAIYPGYGFMAENPQLATACNEAGIVFVGPPPKVLGTAGDKIRARNAAREAEVPTLDSSEVVDDPEAAKEAAEEIGFPLFVKAAQGGGGRGMRLIAEADQLDELINTAMSEAEGAFGDSSVYLEQALVKPRHIEVQILADAEGNIMHLFERDCSLQRRYQKVLELAPAPNLDRDLRDRICDTAVQFARHINYVNAGTVEFLVDDESGEFAFIEMNPRIQVEHTVTEETTEVDLVQAQLRIAGGETLDDLGLSQDSVSQRGFAVQCRVTTEDPATEFRPDVGRISVYRPPGGAGIRIDEGNAYVGAEISPYFDPLLSKVTARGSDLRHAARRAQRAIAEFRVRGVKTNQAFLGALLADEEVLSGRTYTTYVDDHPQLTQVDVSSDRATRLLRLLADVTVNRPNGEAPPGPDAIPKLPALQEGDPPDGTRQRLQELGPADFASWLRSEQALHLTDTTMRDAHQSLFATRMRTYDMDMAAPHVARRLPGMFSMEVWGGATFDVALRFLTEDPWIRLARLREDIPNICFQMLLRGQNLLGYNAYPEEVVRAFVAEAAETGIDLFRIFDSLNNVEPMRAAIEATLEAGAIAEGVMCYSGDLSNPQEDLYTLDYYLGIASQLVDMGVHMLCIKDMAGLLRAPAASTLITKLRSEFDLPVHLHTHDTAGGQLATYLAAINAGVDVVDGAAAPMAGMTSQPALPAIVAATNWTERETPVSLDALADFEPYWEAVRDLYQPFETGLRAPTGRVYRHEIPGGQLSNLRSQAVSMGLADRFEQIEDMYAQVNEFLGRPVKVTPSSKVVGDLALYCVSSGIELDELTENPGDYDLPASVIGFLRGELGTPAAGFPQPFTERVLESAEAPEEEEGIGEEMSDRLAQPGADRRRALAELIFPTPAQNQQEASDHYGDVSVVPTRAFFYGMRQDEEVIVDLEPGVRLTYELEAISDPDEKGFRQVLTRLNGATRPIDVRDESIEVAGMQIEQADPDEPGHVAAGLAGVVTVQVAEGDEVKEDQAVAVLEAMKMESTVSAPIAGTVQRLSASSGTNLEAGDLIMVIGEESEGEEGEEPEGE